MLLYLVRHGESTYNAEGRIQGQSDAPLSELGHRQTEAVAAALANLPIEAVYASPLRRALETAQRIAEKHICGAAVPAAGGGSAAVPAAIAGETPAPQPWPGGPLAVHTDRRLMELDAGVFEGRLRSELADIYPTEFAQWLSGDEDFVIPGGESRRQLAVRGCAALRWIAAAGHRQAVVVTHGGLLSVTLRSLLNLHEPLPPFSLQNGSITRVTCDERGQFALVALNEADHLREAGLSRGGDL